jgi:hypothetical protein
LWLWQVVRGLTDSVAGRKNAVPCDAERLFCFPQQILHLNPRGAPELQTGDESSGNFPWPRSTRMLKGQPVAFFSAYFAGLRAALAMFHLVLLAFFSALAANFGAMSRDVKTFLRSASQ